MFGLAIILIGIGVGLLVYSMLRGGSEISLVLIFPVISSDGDLFGIIGIFFIFTGIITLYISSFFSRISKSAIYERNGSGIHDLKMIKDQEDFHDVKLSQVGTETRFKTGGVVFIGPIPIIFGSHRWITRWMIVVGGLIALVIIVVFVLQFSRL